MNKIFYVKYVLKQSEWHENFQDVYTHENLIVK